MKSVNIQYGQNGLDLNGKNAASQGRGLGASLIKSKQVLAFATVRTAPTPSRVTMELRP